MYVYVGRKSVTGANLQQSGRYTDLLSHDEFRWFWITWSNDVIAAGRGNRAGYDVMLSYGDPAPSAVNSMAVASADSMSASWVIPSRYYDTGTVRRTRSCSASGSAYSHTFLRSVVCLSVVCHTRALCLNRSTDLDAIWQLHLWGPVTHCVRWRGP